MCVMLNVPADSGNISYKRADKNIFGDLFEFFGQNNVLEGLEKPHAQNFDKIRIGKI